MATAKDINIKKIINEKLVIIDKESKTKDEILKKLSELLENNNYVKDSFYEGIINREDKFPTGLITANVNVAIPHTDSEHIKESAIAIAILNKPIDFYRMDISDQKVEVEIVFMLAMKDKEKQITLISTLVSAFQDPNLLLSLKSFSTKEEVVEKLQQYFN